MAKAICYDQEVTARINGVPYHFKLIPIGIPEGNKVDKKFTGLVACTIGNHSPTIAGTFEDIWTTIDMEDEVVNHSIDISLNGKHPHCKRRLHYDNTTSHSGGELSSHLYMRKRKGLFSWERLPVEQFSIYQK